jgi:nucleolar protein 15
MIPKSAKTTKVAKEPSTTAKNDPKAKIPKNVSKPVLAPRQELKGSRNQKFAPGAQGKPKPSMISHEGAKPKSALAESSKVAPLKKSKKADDTHSVAVDSEDTDAQSDDEEEEDDVHLHGFSSDDENSSDEELEDDVGLDVTKLPTRAKDDEAVKRKLEKAKREAVCICFVRSP